MVRKFSEGQSVAKAMGVNETWQLSKNERSQGTTETTTETPSTNYSYDPTERPVVYPGELSKLPSPRMEGETSGLVARAYVVVETLAWKECATHMEKASFTVREDVEDFQPRANSDYDSDDIEWKETDFQRLGLLDEPKAPAAKSPEENTPFERMFSGGGRGQESDPGGEDEEDEDGPENFLMWFEEGELP
jgi:hypothetical protein